MPRVSVIIPLYNKEKYVARAIRSVLYQTYDFEVIVVDGGSTDREPEIVEGFARRDKRVRLIRQDNRGPSAARNRGAKEAQGELLAFLDADDEWLPQFLERCVGLLERYPEAGLASTGWLVVSDKPLWTKGADLDEGIFDGGFKYIARKGFPLYTSATVIRKEVFNAVDGFNESLRRGEDTNMWVRIFARGYKLAHAPEVLVKYHRNTDNLSDLFRAIKAPPSRWALDWSALDIPEEFKSSPDYPWFLKFRRVKAEEFLGLLLLAGRWGKALEFAKKKRFPY